MRSMIANIFIPHVDQNDALEHHFDQHDHLNHHDDDDQDDTEHRRYPG